MNIVAISGKLCSGKTTLAKAVVEARPEYEIVPLADALKLKVAQACDVSLGYMAENKGVFRELLQIYGTDVMRKVHGDDYWVDRVLAYAVYMGSEYIIVDDVRYPNELERLAEAADRFMSIRLLVNTDQQQERHTSLYGEPPDYDKLNHISETALDDYPDFQMVVLPHMPLDFLVDQVLAGMERRGM